MKHIKVKIFIFSLLFFILILCGKYLMKTTAVQTGYVISINNESHSIWVVDDNKDFDFTGKTEKELQEIFKYEGIIYTLPWYFPSSLTERLKLGQAVTIYYDGDVRISAPGRSDSYWLSIHEE